MKRILFIILLSLSIIILSAEDVFAARGGGGSGGHSITAGITTVSADQKDLNSIIDSVNSTQGGVSTKSLNSAYDFFIQYQYRFSGSIFALVFRPSYFTESGKGSGNTVGDYNHSLTGFTFFPLLRLYPLENSFIRFFMQAGVGFGYLKGEVKQGDASLSYSGSNFGAQAGLGAEFCFTENHCMTLEGNVRYLPIERNVADSVSGTLTGFTQAQNSREVEYDQNDMATTMSGIQGVLGYTYNF
jgi:opacity protein-like surface antigen